MKHLRHIYYFLILLIASACIPTTSVEEISTPTIPKTLEDTAILESTSISPPVACQNK